MPHSTCSFFGYEYNGMGAFLSFVKENRMRKTVVEYTENSVLVEFLALTQSLFDRRVTNFEGVKR